MGRGIAHRNVLRKPRTMYSDYMSVKMLSQLQKMKIFPMVCWFESVASYIVKIIYYLL